MHAVHIRVYQGSGIRGSIRVSVLGDQGIDQGIKGSGDQKILFKLGMSIARGYYKGTQ